MTTVNTGEVWTIQVTVTDSAGNTQTFNTGTQTVQGIAPTLAASDSLSGRTLTITVGGTTGNPTPTTSLTTLTLDGTTVSPTTTGSGVWAFDVPSSEFEKTVNWTVTATNSEGTDTVSGVQIVAPDLADTTAPSLSAFSVGPQDGTDLPIEVSVDDDPSKPIDFYVVGISAGATAPSAAQVKAGTDATGTAATVATSWAVNVDGSTTTIETISVIPSDTYDFYIAAEDSASNLTATPLSDLGVTYA